MKIGGLRKSADECGMRQDETGKRPIYDDMDLAIVKGIGLHKILE